MNPRHLAVLLAVLTLTSCGFPSDHEVETAFLSLAAYKVPSEITLEVVSTYRGDGDDESFSQVVIFNAVAKQDMLVKDGWLSGIEFKKDSPKKLGRVELIYRRRDSKEWVITDDGLTVAPS